MLNSICHSNNVTICLFVSFFFKTQRNEYQPVFSNCFSVASCLLLCPVLKKVFDFVIAPHKGVSLLDFFEVLLHVQLCFDFIFVGDRLITSKGLFYHFFVFWWPLLPMQWLCRWLWAMCWCLVICCVLQVCFLHFLRALHDCPCSPVPTGNIWKKILLFFSALALGHLFLCSKHSYLN